jgi:hypothetical protein
MLAPGKNLAAELHLSIAKGFCKNTRPGMPFPSAQARSHAMRRLREPLLSLSLALLAAQVSPGRASAAPEQKPAAGSGTTPVAKAAAPPALDPGRGQEIGLVVEAYLTPHQEGDEEEATPNNIPKQFRASTPSQSRAAREAAGHRGYGQVRFTKDFSRAFIDVRIEGVSSTTINMFHIHCGKPGILGPILVDFALSTDLQKDLADGTISVEIRNEHLVKNIAQGHGVIGAFTAGCIIPSLSLGSLKPSKITTIAGMAQLAAAGELYFNLHTTGQTYFGDMRGQLQRIEK